jgi:hypothetical protein
MLRKYFCSPVDLIGDRATVSPLGGGGGSMDLTVKVEEDEEDDDATVGGRTAPNWLQELNNGVNNSVNSSWDSGVVLDTNTVVQMAEFQEIIDSLQKCGAGEGMALPPPPYNSSSSSNSNHHLNNTNSFHATQQQQPAMSSAPPPTVVLSPSSSPPPVTATTASQHQFLYPDLELEQMLLLPPQRLGAASYHGGESSALLTAAEKLGRGVVTCQSLPLLTDQQATLAAGNSNNMAVSAAGGGEHYALQLRCAAGDCTQEPLSLVCHPFARKLLAERSPALPVSLVQVRSLSLHCKIG